MPSLKDVKNKIAGVKKTKQITRAMNMVASAKLRKAQERIVNFRPYAEKFYEILADLSSRADQKEHPLLEVHEHCQQTGIILVTSDKGLCGSFNLNLIQEAVALARAKEDQGKAVSFYCVGKKGRDAARKRGFKVSSAHIEAMNAFDFSLASDLGTEIIGAYLEHRLDEVFLVYGEFESLIRQPAKRLQILPIIAQGDGQEAGAGPEYIYEPSVSGLLAEILPRYIRVQIYRGLLDTSASEHAARMNAMENATSNCDDMISSLTLVYNKTRQAAITTELMDIVSGAEALQ